MAHSIISPAILYWGTPVALISSSNENGTTNICPISSVFWLGHRCILGFLAESKTPQNILRTQQCVVNLVDESMSSHVNALASMTGTEDPSASKLARGYRYVKDKWNAASLTPQAPQMVQPDRVGQCQVQMECQLITAHSLMQDLPDLAGAIVTMELRVARIHVLDSLRMPGYADRIDPDKWRPMIMSFQQLYGLGREALTNSELAKVDEEKYRIPDTEDNAV